ncbi:DUF4258 domain-containing protein [Candidatus Woesearchaeota archaeon]|nr:DUF4258 domain-containing protein [Candidatus Woesearchaeota archaeon]
MNYKDVLKNKLKRYKKEDIIITYHAIIRIRQRQIDESEIIENLLNPKRLEYAIKGEAESEEEEKFDCYFGYSNTLCHRYVIVIKNNVVVVTVVKINRRWQKIVEKKLKNRRIK